MQETFNKLLTKVSGLSGDMEKAAAGNKSAGTRVRQGMQEVKSLAQQLRVEIIQGGK